MSASRSSPSSTPVSALSIRSSSSKSWSRAKRSSHAGLSVGIAVLQRVRRLVEHEPADVRRRQRLDGHLHPAALRRLPGHMRRPGGEHPVARLGIPRRQPEIGLRSERTDQAFDVVQVQHLLVRDLEDRLLPGTDALELDRAPSVLPPIRKRRELLGQRLQRAGREQVRVEQPVLEPGRLVQESDEKIGIPVAHRPTIPHGQRNRSRSAGVAVRVRPGRQTTRLDWPPACRSRAASRAPPSRPRSHRRGVRRASRSCSGARRTTSSSPSSRCSGRSTAATSTRRCCSKRLPSQGERVLQGPGENAGVIDLGDGVAVAFKVESHNHPSRGRAVPGRRDRRRRDHPRRGRDGRAADRAARRAALRRARLALPPRRRGHRPLRQLHRHPERRRRDGLRRGVRGEPARERDVRRPAADRARAAGEGDRRPATCSCSTARSPAATGSAARPCSRARTSRAPTRSGRRCRSATRSAARR